MNHELIRRINELANLSKKRKLTENELEEQKKLRKEYISIFRHRMRQHLDNITFVDENGHQMPLKINKKGNLKS